MCTPFVDGEGRRRLGQVCLRLRAASPSPSVARLGMTDHARRAAKDLHARGNVHGKPGRASVMLCFTVELTTFKARLFWAHSTDGGNRTLGQMVLETIPLYAKLAGLAYLYF